MFFFILLVFCCSSKFEVFNRKRFGEGGRIKFYSKKMSTFVIITNILKVGFKYIFHNSGLGLFLKIFGSLTFRKVPLSRLEGGIIS